MGLGLILIYFVAASAPNGLPLHLIQDPGDPPPHTHTLAHKGRHQVPDPGRAGAAWDLQVRSWAVCTSYP